MSLRKLSGAAAGGSRESYATTSVAPNTSSSSSAVAGTGGAKNAYSTHLAIQSDAAKYRGKYKELKKKVRQIETENDRLHVKTLRVKRNIQRMRLERAILYERLEAELQENGVAQMPVDEPMNAVEETHQPTVTTHAQTSTRDFDTPSPPVGAAADSTQARQEGENSSGGRARRNLDYSPSPEEQQIAPESNGKATASNSSPVEQPATPAPAAVKPESGRSSMKITLKRHSNANNGGK
ncbi:uncharacterized protein FA14DRAFT_159423 [Meira miltonrushii]|uniref:INO80 complex subunit F domain-containing protein n=1 Tax=Meira miltonrushii TaxID=1280837 RepID=A0A316VLP5_9BASI|nr:uncharacterized protein FA14DRAFT_159423 [Meira miltonrushii]PWN37313.1 hypothetical protein FA14DRAFT_159423 [Meira miltonrushii]